MSLSPGPASDAARQLAGDLDLRASPEAATIGRTLLRRPMAFTPGGLVLYLHPTLADTDLSLPRPDTPGSPPLTSAQLVAITDQLAERADRWRPIVRHDPDRRWYTRLAHSHSVEVWLLGWSPGQHVPAHDHGGAAGAFTVVDGTLVEDQLDPATWATTTRTTFAAGSRTAFGPDHAHILGNRASQAATSVDAYSPPGLPLRFGPAGAARPAPAELLGSNRVTRTIDQLLDQARARLERLNPHQAAAVLDAGGLLIDIRPAAQRVEEGQLPGAIIIERNVLEWRLDPTSPHRLAQVQGYDQPIVICCSEGYTSSLAAAVLQDLGLHQATDLVGGFKAWVRAGLPVQPTQPT